MCQEKTDTTETKELTHNNDCEEETPTQEFAEILEKLQQEKQPNPIRSITNFSLHEGGELWRRLHNLITNI